MNTLGRYEIHEEIGRGAMGLVYRGVDPKISRTVALKCLRANLLEGREDTGKRFQREMRALGRLIHPNIVTIFDAGKDEASGQAYIVMEYVEGVSLAQLIKDGKALPVDQIVQIGIQVCRGLHFAHLKGVIHRDIKPGNILLSDDLECIKITDFGIARLDNAALTQTDRLTGTPQYMSPEQCRGETLDGRSDLFAVGTLLYELLTREKAFQGDSAAAIMHQVLNHTPYPPSIVSEKIPRNLSGVVMQALEKAPDHRFASGEEMADDLARTIEAPETFSLTDEVVATNILTADERETSSEKQISFWPRYAVLISVLLVIATGMFFLLRGSPKTAGHKKVDIETGVKKLTDAETRAKEIAKAKADAEAKAKEIAKAKAKAKADAEAKAKEIAKAKAKAKADTDIQRLKELAAGLVQFDTTPSGADILINGNQIGISPMSIELAAGRPHELVVKKEGYHALEATIDVPAGEKTPINLKLLEEEKP